MEEQYQGIFDESEFVVDSGSQQEEVDSFVKAMKDPIPTQDNSKLQDVDRRLEIAMYYRELIKSPLFSEESESAQFVENEMRGFVRHRLGVLLGVETEKVDGQFTLEEVTGLKQLLGAFSNTEIQSLKMVAKKLAKIANEPGQEKPTVAQRVVPAAPKPPVRRKPVATPALAQRPGPVAIAPVQPKAQSRANSASTPKAPSNQPQVEVGPDGSRVARIGHKVFQEAVNAKGESYVKDITPKVNDPHAVPLPTTSEAWAAVTADLAGRSLQASAPKSGLLADAAYLAIHKQD